MGTPKMRLISVAPTPIWIDNRVPMSKRLSTSRPNSSVPSQCVAPGGRNRDLIAMVSHGYGAIQGASNPSVTIVSVITSPALS